MTAQELFDRAVGGVIKQGALGLDSTIGTCTYFDPPTGNRCGIGHLMDLQVWEDHGQPSNYFEHTPAVQDAVVASNPGLNLDEHHTLLCRIQNTHDSAGFLHRFIERAKELARDFDLEWNHD